jgi:hypothetical protein
MTDANPRPHSSGIPLWDTKAFDTAPIRYTRGVLVRLHWALLTTGTLATAFIWMELQYRCELFCDDYHAHPFLNHVNDGYFEFMSRAAYGAAAITVIASLGAVRRRRWTLATCGLLVAALALAHPPMLDHLHRSGIVVTYDEFAQVYGPGHAARIPGFPSPSSAL